MLGAQNKIVNVRHKIICLSQWTIVVLLPGIFHMLMAQQSKRAGAGNDPIAGYLPVGWPESLPHC